MLFVQCRDIFNRLSLGSYQESAKFMHSGPVVQPDSAILRADAVVGLFPSRHSTLSVSPKNVPAARQGLLQIMHELMLHWACVQCLLVGILIEFNNHLRLMLSQRSSFMFQCPARGWLPMSFFIDFRK